MQGDNMFSLSRYCTRRVFFYCLLLVVSLQVLIWGSLRAHYSGSFPFASSASQSHIPGQSSDLPGSDRPLATSSSTNNAGYGILPHCDATQESSDIVVVVKTGANEIYEKLPTQLMTTLQCYDHLLFFSDLEQHLGPYQIHDALDNVTESIKSEDKVFDYYRTLQEYHKLGLNIGSLKMTTGKAAWDLDKYKFLHMLEKTWQMRPGQKWYVFIEADTYLVQTNLLQWLDRMDSSVSHFLGSPTYFDSDAFPHGGSGFVLSGAALSKFAKNDPGVAARYDGQLREALYGDRWLMKALRDKGVEFEKVWPMLQAEKPSTIPFGSGPGDGIRHWCQPILTMHHITSDEVSRIWRFEQDRPDPAAPLLMKEIFDGMVSSRMSETIEDWHNISDDVLYKPPEDKDRWRTKPPKEMSDVEKEAHMSIEHCNKACAADPKCYQTIYFGHTCGFSFSFRLGTRRMPKDGLSFRSSFNLARIEEFEKANPCPSPAWI